jgi:hypothetical protein
MVNQLYDKATALFCFGAIQAHLRNYVYVIIKRQLNLLISAQLRAKYLYETQQWANGPINLFDGCACKESIGNVSLVMQSALMIASALTLF